MELFLHIGLHKTGTTYMQKAIFRFWPEIHYAGRPFRENPLLAISSPEAGEKNVLVSNESLSGSLKTAYSGSQPWAERQYEQITQLARVFPYARPLLSFRQHGSWLLSLYKHYLKYGGTASLEEFYDISPNQTGVLKRSDLMQYDRLRWTREAFASEPFVFFCEELQHGLPGLLAELAELFGTPMPQLGAAADRKYNEGVNAAQAHRLLKTNRLLVRAFRGKAARRIIQSFHGGAYRLARRSAAPLALPEQHRSFIREHYADDWHAVLDYALSTRRFSSEMQRLLRDAG